VKERGNSILLRDNAVIRDINTSANPISGAFNNLADGRIVTVKANNLQASYNGGDGHDLTPTVAT